MLKGGVFHFLREKNKPTFSSPSSFNQQRSLHVWYQMKDRDYCCRFPLEREKEELK